jgi:hypothetical protein
VIVVAGTKWQGDSTASYHCGTETNGVQRSEDLNVISQEIFDPTPSLRRSIDLNQEDLEIRRKDQVEKGITKRFLCRKGRLVNKFLLHLFTKILDFSS